MNKLLVICGPTATGKTSLGISLAQKVKGEIVSADSRQVYRGMDIGTGKDINQGKWKKDHWEIKGIPIWLLDVVDPNQRFSVADYLVIANKTIDNIHQKQKLPLLVGGTGFYIKGILEGIETLGILPDWEQRWRFKDWPTEKLFRLLGRLDPEKSGQMNVSDRQNPRRLMRAIEVAQANKKSINKRELRPKSTNCLLVGLKAPLDFLYKRIDQRVVIRVQQGIKKEIQALIKKGYDWNNSALGETLGYQEWQSFFKKELSQKEVVKRWQFNEHAYARRQLTWFKKIQGINWFDISEKDWQKRLEKLVLKWYSEADARED